MEGNMEDMAYMAFNCHTAEQKIVEQIVKMKELHETDRPEQS